MNEFGILTLMEVLDASKRFSLDCLKTDFANTLWCDHYRNKTCFWVDEVSITNDHETLGYGGGEFSKECFIEELGVRPVFNYTTEPIQTNEKQIGEQIVKTMVYGEYPQEKVDKDFGGFLTAQKEAGMLEETGKYYTYYKEGWNSAWGKPYEEHKLQVYKLFDRKYVYYDNKYHGGWFEVKPITWILDTKQNLAISEKILFKHHFVNHNFADVASFHETDLYKFINNVFAKEMLFDENYSLVNNEVIKIDNYYNFNFNDISNEERIIASLKTNIPILFLSEKSLNSNLIKQYSEDCVIVCLDNATADSLIGINKYEPSLDRMIEASPTWYDDLKQKCERDPEKIHIVYFTNFSDAKLEIQKKVPRIVSERIVNGKWPLPENARIVISATNIRNLDPQIYECTLPIVLKDNIEEFFKFAVSKNEKIIEPLMNEELCTNIHPSIYHYVAFKNLKGEDVLANNWEMASKLLYNSANPNYLLPILGAKVFDDFISFLSLPSISVDNNNLDLTQVSVNEILATIVRFGDVNFNDYEKVSNFIKFVGAQAEELFKKVIVMYNREDLIELVNQNSVQKVMK